MVHATPAAAKTALRALIRGRRKQLAVAAPDAGAQAAKVGRLALGGRFPEPVGKVAALYHALGSELDARPLARVLAAAGWTLALPRIEGPDETLVFRAWTLGDTLVGDAAGMRAPVAGAERLDPDLVIVPLLAFDRSGHRLGQGKGHYDRALAALRTRKPVLVVGLAYAGQEVANLPAEAHDQRLDAILTETAYIEVQIARDP